MHVVIFGGTGQLGALLGRWLREQGHTTAVVGRSVEDPTLRWDGVHDGPWMEAVDGADAVINLAGRTVNCRYHWENLNQMMQSRVDSCEAVGRAIAKAANPPAVWVQASTASIYANNLGEPFGESGTIGGKEDNVPAYWAYSVAIARAWELALAAAPTPHTRKVALRTGFAMSPDRGGVFDWLVWIVQRGLGGPFIGGEQYVSWIADIDWVRAVLFCMEEPLTGPVNLTAPEPLTNREFMRCMVHDLQAPAALPIAGWMAGIGAWFLETDVELMKKSRRVIPEKLLEAGFQFDYPEWPAACRDLVTRWQADDVLAKAA